MTETNQLDYLVNNFAKIFAQLIYCNDQTLWDDNLKNTMEGIRALLLHHLDVSSSELAYQFRKDGVAFSNLQEKFDEILYGFFKLISTSDYEFQQYQEAIRSFPRLKKYNEDQ